MQRWACPHLAVHVPGHAAAQLLGADLLRAGAPGVVAGVAGGLDDALQGVVVSVGRMRVLRGLDLITTHEVVAACAATEKDACHFWNRAVVKKVSTLNVHFINALIAVPEHNRNGATSTYHEVAYYQHETHLH
jgi:hypothetical protein